MSLLRLALAAAPLLGGAAAACNFDNCYNQLAHHSGDASSFCAALTMTQTVTAVTGFPTYLSTSCGAARASSACSCLWPAGSTATATTATAATVTVTATVTSVSVTTVSVCPSATNLVVNGGFETDDLSPWYNGDIINE